MPQPSSHTNGVDNFHNGFQHLVHHNMSTSYPRTYDDHSQMSSQYGSPTPTEGDDGAYVYQGHQPDYGFADSKFVQYKDRGYSPDYQGSVYDSQYSTPATSPPHYMDTMRTRSGLGVTRSQAMRPLPESRPRQQNVTRVRRAKKEKIKAEKKITKLEQPLSVLTKDWTHVAVVDIEAYVNRSAEVRIREVAEGKNPGKVKRPMNSFMLYRKAYQNRTKDWCLQNNHQVVSQVCGDSWPLEPDEVKDQFSEWARIERINHQNAHPGYKFSPTKPGTAKAAKRKVSEELSDESDLEDYDWRNEDAGGRNRKKHRSIPRMLEQSPPRAVSYPPTHSAYHYSSRENSMEPGIGGVHRSSYQANNPGRPMPTAFEAHLQNGEYYQQSVHSFQNIPGTQDVILKRTSTPGLTQPYLGLQSEYDMLQPYAPFDQYSQHRIDPSLIESEQPGFGGSLFCDVNQGGYSLPHDHHAGGWQQPLYDIGAGNDFKSEPTVPFLATENRSGMVHDPTMNDTGGNKETWQGDSLENSAEFDKWMEDSQSAGLTAPL